MIREIQERLSAINSQANGGHYANLPFISNHISYGGGYNRDAVTVGGGHHNNLSSL